jgi:hypothetical protein
MKLFFVAVVLFLVMQIPMQAVQWKIIVDDYQARSVDSEWPGSRIGTNCYSMGDGNYEITFLDGNARVFVNGQFDWGGLLTSLIHKDTECNSDHNSLNPGRLLGDYILEIWQAQLTGIEIELVDGEGDLKVELKDCDNHVVFEEIRTMSGGGVELFEIDLNDPNTRIKLLNWIVNHQGFAIVSEVRLIVELPDMDWETAAFLLSYSHLLQAYDPDTGFVRDRTEWPAVEFAAVQCMGTVALATVIAADLGFVSLDHAYDITQTIKDAILDELPRCHGLLPHFVKYDHDEESWQIVQDPKYPDKTEWSSIDTLISVIGMILACQAIGIETYELENLITEIDWNKLTSHETEPVSHGYAFSCPAEPLEHTWDTFGAESFLVALAYAAANEEIPIITYSDAVTWNGSGFIDEMATLFFPMTGLDYWNNDWSEFRSNAFNDQRNYFDQYPDTPYIPYTELGLFGVSASEVPEPWLFDEDTDIYHGWGIGGRIPADDGFGMMGYPILAPHYVAMVSKEFPDESEQVWNYLMAQKLFSPMNQVESFGRCEENQNRWNSLKGSWNLSLQTLGFARMLSGSNYLPHRVLADNQFLRSGFYHILQCNHGDVNFDGSITAADAQLAFLITLSIYNPTFEEYCAADCDANGVVTAGDAQQIFLAAIGMGSCVDPIITPTPAPTFTPTPTPSPDYFQLRVECECYDRMLGGSNVGSIYASGEGDGCVLADTWGGQNPVHEPVQTEWAEYDDVVIPYDVSELMVQIRYSDYFDGVNMSNLVIIKFNDIQKGEFNSVNTGNSWDDYDCITVNLGYIPAGSYTVRIESNGGYWNAINMDYLFFYDALGDEPVCTKYFTGCPCS